MANRNFTREMPTPPALSGTALELVALFMLPKETGKAKIACKMWNEDFRASNSFVWKQAALNMEPGIVQAVIDDAESREGGVDSVDFYRLAVGLSLNQEETRASGSQLSGQKRKAKDLSPTFRIEDLLIVVEIKRKVVEKDKNNQDVTVMKSLGVFSCSDCSNLLQGSALSGGVELNVTGDPAFTIEGTNPLHKNNPSFEFCTTMWSTIKRNLSNEAADLNDPEDWRERFLIALNVAGRNATGRNSRYKQNFVESIVLIRKDDWRSFRIVDNLASSDESYGFSASGPPYGPAEAIEAFSSYYCDVRGNHQFCCLSTYEFMAMPTSGSAEEPTWLRKIRNAAHYSDLDWTDQDDEEMRSVPSFSFRLSSLKLELDLWSKENCKYITRNERLLKLNDLDWK